MIRNSAARRDVSVFVKLALVSVALVGLFVYLPLALFSRQLLSWWLGPAMGEGAAVVTSLWAIVAIVYLAMTVLYNHVQAQGRPRILLLINVIGLAIPAVGICVMPRTVGIEGIALLMGLAFLAQFCGLWLFGRSSLQPFARESITPSGSESSAAGGGGYG
jgi:O-antigen/teichoic acid export membrane protein